MLKMCAEDGDVLHWRKGLKNANCCSWAQKQTVITLSSSCWRRVCSSSSRISLSQWMKLMPNIFIQGGLPASQHIQEGCCDLEAQKFWSFWEVHECRPSDNSHSFIWSIRWQLAPDMTSHDPQAKQVKIVQTFPQALLHFQMAVGTNCDDHGNLKLVPKCTGLSTDDWTLEELSDWQC